MSSFKGILSKLRQCCTEFLILEIKVFSDFLEDLEDYIDTDGILSSSN